MLPRDERIARNEGWLKQANKRIERESAGLTETEFAGGRNRIDFFCECGRALCAAQVGLTPAEYDHAHAERDHYVVVPGHETPELERVVERHEGYIVVEKAPRAEAWAEKIPPSSR